MKSPTDRSLEQLRTLQEEDAQNDSSLPQPPPGHRFNVLPDRANRDRRPSDWSTLQVCMYYLEQVQGGGQQDAKENDDTVALRAQRINAKPSPLEPATEFDRLRDDITDLCIAWARASSQESIPTIPSILPAYGVLPAGRRSNAVSIAASDGGFTLGIDTGLLFELGGWTSDLMRLASFSRMRRSSAWSLAGAQTLSRRMASRTRETEGPQQCAPAEETELFRACRLFVLAHEMAHISLGHCNDGQPSTDAREVDADAMALKLLVRGMSGADTPLSPWVSYAGGVLTLLLYAARTSVLGDVRGNRQFVLRYQSAVSACGELVFPALAQHVVPDGLRQQRERERCALEEIADLALATLRCLANGEPNCSSDAAEDLFHVWSAPIAPF